MRAEARTTNLWAGREWWMEMAERRLVDKCGLVVRP